MTNQITLIQIVLERLGGNTLSKEAYFYWDEVQDWPTGSLDLLEKIGLLKLAQAMTSVECDGCEEKCIMPVVIYPTQLDKLGRAFIVCDKPVDLGRINVSFDRMRQWRCTLDAVCKFVAANLGLQFNNKHVANTNLWEIGIYRGAKRSQMLCLRADAGLALVAGNNKLPLIDVIEYQDGTYSLNNVLIHQLVDTATTADNRYTPSNAKREASKLDTQAIYASWQKEYRALKKKRPKMSDVWYSKQIEKMDIANGRNFSTIKKHMLP